MLPTRPESWPIEFENALAARDLEAAIALYEPDARFVAANGDVIEGSADIREVLARLIEANVVLHGHIVRNIVLGDVAVLYTDFEGMAHDASGTSVGVTSQAIEVLRRQPDGTWKLILGDPNARAGGQG